MPATAIVLTGGRSSRFGSDKTRALIEGRPLLDHVLDSLPASWPIVAVGPARRTSREVVWVREEPMHGGPLAALAVGLALVETRSFVLLGADMPHVSDVPLILAGRLDDEPDEVDAIAARTPDGRLQPLLLAARTEPGRRALPTDPAGASLMSWLKNLRYEPHDVSGQQAHDIDTTADLP